MGLTIEVDTLEQMCALMCDNYIPEECEINGTDSSEEPHTDKTV